MTKTNDVCSACGFKLVTIMISDSEGQQVTKKTCDNINCRLYWNKFEDAEQPEATEKPKRSRRNEENRVK